MWDRPLNVTCPAMPLVGQPANLTSRLQMPSQTTTKQPTEINMYQGYPVVSENVSEITHMAPM